MEYIGIAWLGLLLLINAFFVGASFAVISARRSQIEPRAAAGSRSARTALWAMEHASLMLATSQLGITVASLLILNVSEPAIHHLLEVPLGLTGWPEQVIGTVSFVIALLLVSFLHVVLGEMVPKNLSFSVPERAVLILAPPLVFVASILRPIIWALNAITRGILRLFRVDAARTRRTACSPSTRCRRSCSTRRARACSPTRPAPSPQRSSSPRRRCRTSRSASADLVTLPEDATPADVERAVAQHGFSRYILVDETASPAGTSTSRT